MTNIDTVYLPDDADYRAPDGSEVRLLCRVDGGSAAEFRLEPGMTTRAVLHRTVDEIWYLTEGSGELWHDSGDESSAVARLVPGTRITIPVGTGFQFQSHGEADLGVLGVTIPPWPGESEAMPVDGRWAPSFEKGAHDDSPQNGADS